VAFDGDAKGKAELLTDLEEDLDLRGFLPTAEVKEGDSWKIPVEAVKALLRPGGDVKLRPESTEVGMSGMEPVPAVGARGSMLLFAERSWRARVIRRVGVLVMCVFVVVPLGWRLLCGLGGIWDLHGW
jgi:hypothetical protein